ncbi:MAG TPA: sigma-70 family RNA polymerase sigma factor [Gaiellaceae bacterium]|nr:sigma-70 family RNA polymerase sigma factor [Gaiellaceae bacterium]
MEPAAVTDLELVARCRAGDDAAWHLLVERFSRFVYAISVRGFRLAEPDAEDVFQEVFAKTFEQLHRLRDDGAIRPWLAQLTRRACIDRLRADRETAVADVEDTAVDELAEIDRALDVRNALGALPESCREILDRFFARDESYRTIGDELGLPAGTIASRISRCLEKLKSIMEDPHAAGRPVDG